MSRRVAFDVESDELRNALEEYGKSRGLKLSDLARTALYEYVRRRPPKSLALENRLRRIF